MPKRLLGDCCRQVDHFLIRVDSSQPEQGQLDTLFHEFAHAIASEIMGREDIMARKRAEAAQAGQQAFNLAGQFYTAPGLQLLSSQPLSYQVGNQMMGLGLDAIGAGKPQLFDVGSALNLGAAQRQNIVNAQAANAQAQASYSSGLFGGIGSVVGGAAAGLGTMASTATGAALI
jgi:hypothetical protein